MTAFSCMSYSSQAPVKQFGLAARYTGALYSAAVKAKALDKVDKEIAQVFKFHAHRDLISEHVDNFSYRNTFF